MSKRKNQLSGKSPLMTRFNRRLPAGWKRSAPVGRPCQVHDHHGADDNNIVEFDNVCSYFFSDVGTVKAVGWAPAAPPSAEPSPKSVTSLSLMQLLQRPQGQTVGGEIRLNMVNGKAYNIVNTPHQRDADEQTRQPRLDDLPGADDQPEPRVPLRLPATTRSSSCTTPSSTRTRSGSAPSRCSSSSALPRRGRLQVPDEPPPAASEGS